MFPRPLAVEFKVLPMEISVSPVSVTKPVEIVEAGIKHLGTLFRTLRFSDKPSECSCTSFSCDLSRVSVETRRILDIAQKWSLLIAVSDRRDWGSDRIGEQFQLNP